MAGPSGATSRLALPYPIPSDTADVPRDVQALADKLDVSQGLGIPIAAALPASPANGQQVIWKPTPASLSSNAGVYWHMIADGGQWWYLGGPPAETISFASWTWAGPLTTVVPYVGGAGLIIPVAGLWAFEIPPLPARTAQSNTVATTLTFGVIDQANAFIAQQLYTLPGSAYSAVEMGLVAANSFTAGQTIRMAAQITLGANTIVFNAAGTGAQVKLRCRPITIPTT